MSGVSVWGAAPSLATMKAMKRSGQKNLFQGGEYWYYFRVYLPYFGPIIFFVFLIAAITGYNTVSGHLVLGSTVSLIFSIAVISSYAMIIPWRKHPSVLILYRTITSFVFSVNIILDSISSDTADARAFAGITEFMLLLGECWLTTIAADLVKSLTNPFISYRYNLHRFSTYSFLFCIPISIIFFFHRECQGRYENIFWIKVESSLSTSLCLWGYYFIWILLMYTYQIWATLFSYNRLRKGLSSSFDIRKQCAMDTFKVLSIYAIYLSLLVFFFIIVSANPNPDLNAPINNLARVALFFVANRGTVDAIAWFMLHDFIRTDPQAPPTSSDSDEKPSREEEAINAMHILESGRSLDHTVGLNDSSVSLDAVEPQEEDDAPIIMRMARSRTMSIAAVQSNLKSVTNEVSKGLTEIASATIDEADLSPQMNIALRQQVVQYVTMGVKEAINNPNPDLLEKSLFQELQEVLFPLTDFAAIEGMEVTEYLLDATHPFKAFSPKVFKELRKQENISEEKYLKTLQSTANERLSEGASGAFMFFCGGGEFIVKTIRDREARVLHDSLKKYSRYLRKNPNSLLCRFIGSYSLAMYEQTFYFVVMVNCFDPTAKINERYDIKGSWVGRSADPVKPTKKVLCRHCNEMFVPADKEQCTVMLGKHEASVVLKDNDLRNRISLRSDEAREVVGILKKDSNLLGELGVLDYSLLIGVKKGKFEIKGEAVVRSSSSQELGAKGSGSDSDSSTVVSKSPSGGGGKRSSFNAHQVIGPSIYHFGIVDFLQDWTFDKEVERNLKIHLYRKDPEGISVMEPIAYKNRFQAKMDQIFALDEEGALGSLAPMSSDLYESDALKAADLLNRVRRNSDEVVINPLLAAEGDEGIPE